MGNDDVMQDDEVGRILDELARAGLRLNPPLPDGADRSKSASSAG